ncbi:unnamed protein product [Cuscuta europaea]|uniref:Complex I assembly factor TIMMDC1, mitochondrial n=1 Tax=Cuscuta europaea TaxID=41803 RepID=A0A9P0YJ57_CUSEU|nr:unnamed protein product [Cuscuta europaea]
MWEYLESMYASKQDLSYVHQLLMHYSRPEMKDQTLFQYYNECKQIFEEKRSRFPITADVKSMQEQEERTFVHGILAGFDPQYERSPKMAGTVNWGTATVIGVFAGMLYGGSKEAAASVSKDAEVMLKLGSTPDKREQYRLMRDHGEKI